LRIEHHGLHGDGRHPLRIDAVTQLTCGAGLFHQLGEQREQRCVGDLDL
jgi:hypothetical protein